MKGILARKIGMTRSISPETGESYGVTLLEAPEVKILQVKTVEKDGYKAAVLGAFPLSKKQLPKNVAEQYKCVGELPLDEDQEYKKGDCLNLENLQEVDAVKITSVSKGKGFTGVIKRWNFSRGPETHGSGHHRQPGSVGMCAKPGRILKGKKMPGRHGARRTTLRSVPVIDIDVKNNLIALKGPVPGAKGTYVFLRTA